MFLRFTTRKKNGQEQRYCSLVENRRVAGGRVARRHALYLGEINDSQQEAWRKTIEIFQEGQASPRTVALFPEDRMGAPFPEGDKRRYGYSRDKRPDCVRVVIALIVTPEGFPLACEVLAGNTSDKTTLADFLKKIEEPYGQAERIWVMDRGIPTEKILEQRGAATPPVPYLAGRPRGRLRPYEQKLARLPWQVAREGVSVKLLEADQELYVLAESKDRVN